MSGSRLARRVALVPRPRKPRAGGVSGPALATKVFHYSCQPFRSPGAGERRPDGMAGMAAACSLTGVCRSARAGGACRVERQAVPGVTAPIHSSLVTKGSSSEVAT
jgi:hypothetical protein